MLSPSALPYIQASVPVLRQHGLEITRTFYRNMFDAHPELRNLFNMGNQENGAQQQSLAAAVFAYAANIEDAAQLTPVIQRIAHKHAAVGIRPDHYPIVGKHLLGAISEVLGEEVATPPLIDAWAEAYQALANVLMDQEVQLYDCRQTTAGGMMPLRVMRREQESDEIVSLYLQTEDGRSPGAFLPGQYVSVQVPLAEDYRQLRQYSLADSTEQPWWRICVKREDADGKPRGAVSNWLHAHALAGETLQVSPAFGDMRLDPAGQAPVALLSAGVGITPMLSMLHTLRDVAPQRSVLFCHANRDVGRHILRDEISQAADRMPNLQTRDYYDQPESAEQLAGPMHMTAEWRPFIDTAIFYLCGPAPFMQHMYKSLRDAGVDRGRIHREVFGPDLLDHLT